MEDLLVLAIVLAAAAWLVRMLVVQLSSRSCGPPAGGPRGSDGFVPLDALSGHGTSPGPRRRDGTEREG
jgi:hypothetical protein